MRYFVTLAGRTLQVELEPDGMRVDGVEVTADLAHVEGTDLRSLLLDGASYGILAARREDGLWGLHLRGRRWAAEVVDERTRAIRALAGDTGAAQGPRPIRAPMPGLVVKVEVAVGDRVEAGQGVAIVEAMKMENELRAEGPAVVAGIRVSPGQAVEKDQILIDLQAPAEAGEGGS
ncbi:MAG: acetyl-CoA carboxylase biotin carboxyl carrier protein subunit [Gemmatimonadetes bacterium]|nr:acetyl-CoA carboxylase biotin carboxyl carrier protein subunit [Gemmatimonadota bacterium]